MNITVVSVGKKHSLVLADAIAVYETRLLSKHQVTWNLISPSTGNEHQQIDEESQKILKVLKPHDYIILLDETGDILTNQQFAEVFDRALTNGSISRIVFVVGGAYGVNDEVRAKADFVWSLSRLVFPHQLVRLILLEQLYRTVAILDNHPYHHQ